MINETILSVDKYRTGTATNWLKNEGGQWRQRQCIHLDMHINIILRENIETKLFD